MSGFMPEGVIAKNKSTYNFWYFVTRKSNKKAA